jgi:hypothetical protein
MSNIITLESEEALKPLLASKGGKFTAASQGASLHNGGRARAFHTQTGNTQRRRSASLSLPCQCGRPRVPLRHCTSLQSCRLYHLDMIARSTPLSARPRPCSRLPRLTPETHRRTHACNAHLHDASTAVVICVYRQNCRHYSLLDSRYRRCLLLCPRLHCHNKTNKHTNTHTNTHLSDSNVYSGCALLLGRVARRFC